VTLIHFLRLPTTVVAKHLPQTDDAKHRHLVPLSVSISLSQFCDNDIVWQSSSKMSELMSHREKWHT